MRKSLSSTSTPGHLELLDRLDGTAGMAGERITCNDAHLVAIAISPEMPILPPTPNINRLVVGSIGNCRGRRRDRFVQIDIRTLYFFV